MSVLVQKKTKTEKTLGEIIKSLGNKNYDYIECRCLWTNEIGKKNDDFFGACAYRNGQLIPLDGDTYSLEDKYHKYEESKDTACEYTDNGGLILTVWEELEYEKEGEKEENERV